MADMDGVLQTEMRGEGGKVVGVMVHIVAVASLRRAAMAAPIMRDDTVSLLQEEQHLIVPIICGERPPVAEDNGLAGAPILVEDLDAVFGSDAGHVASLKCAAKHG